MNLNFYRLNKTENYIILDIKNDIKDENTFLNNFASLIVNNVDIIQIKNSSLSVKRFIPLANKIKNLCAEFNVIFLLSDRCDVTIKVNSDGICMSENELDIHFARHLLGKDKIIGQEIVSPNTDIQDNADFLIIQKKSNTIKDKICFIKKQTKQFQEYDLLYLVRAYP